MKTTTSNGMKVDYYQIKSSHKTLAEAVEASGMDLSYNESEAKRSIKYMEKDILEAFVMDDDEVFYLYKCDITLFNRFTPFITSMSDSPFQLVTRLPETDEMMISHQNWPKSKEVRKLAAKYNFILTSD